MAQNIKPTPKDEQDRDAQLAQALDDNPMWRRALDEIEEAYTREWKLTEGPHDDMRERAYYMVRATEKLRQHLKEYISTGKLNQHRAKEVMKGK